MTAETPRQSSDERGPDSYETLAVPAEAEIKVQRSRFLARAEPATNLEAAKSVVANMGKRYHNCRHVCYAWRGGAGAAIREVRSDGGEPAGTAGEPILVALRQAGLTDCVLVVARYFGGIKLGTGGLARAYGGAATAALESARRRTIQIGREFSLAFPYPLQKTVTHLLQRHGGRTVQEDYTSSVTWRIWLPRARASAFTAAVTEATANEVRITESP